MLFTDKTKSVIEFDKIIEKLVSFCSTEGAKDRARTLMPQDDFVCVKRNLAATTDARKFLDYKGQPGFDAMPDVPDALERADKGATLTTVELLHVASMVRSVHNLKNYFEKNHPFTSTLDEYFMNLLDVEELDRKISKAIVAEDLIADEASTKLADIRRHIRLTHSKIKDVLNSYIQGNKQKELQENIVTMRDGRYVVPVKAEYRQEVKGIVHDTSSSGSTIFIEPMAVVEANNELRTLEIEETREVERILSELSSFVAEKAASLRNDYHLITELAFYFGCARLSENMEGVEPQITENSIISIKKARHPLIQKKSVVPIDISLGESFDTLIITGPNTGGKTVSLKTLGLFVAMAQSGLHLPCDEETTIGIREQILVDIGDEQSIEQSLSTFSSHMVNVSWILKETTDKSLVLFDELGAGTDPVEGAALAISILEETKNKNALTCATTHYSELKMYALNTDRVQNASCEFDVESLKPTYRLIIGAPGKSNAFAISQKLGISDEIIHRAESLLDDDMRHFDTILGELEETRFELEKERKIQAELRAEYEIFKRESEIRLKKKMEDAEKAILEDRTKAKAILDSARSTSEFIFKQLDDLRKEQNKQLALAELERARKAVRSSLSKVEAQYVETSYESPMEEAYVPSRPFKEGDAIYVVPYKVEGTILKLVSDTEAKVIAGSYRGTVLLKNLRLLADLHKKTTPKKTTVKVERSNASDFKMELDIRGRYGDDGWQEVDRYLDEAVLSGVEIVRIVHGKGTGALRKAIQANLKKDPRVKSFRLGELGEGDSGVTVVTLK